MRQLARCAKAVASTRPRVRRPTTANESRSFAGLPNRGRIGQNRQPCNDTQAGRLRSLEEITPIHNITVLDWDMFRAVETAASPTRKRGS